MESIESKWLKSVFHETEYYHSDSPKPKRMKFMEVSNELQMHFPENKYTPYDISRLIHEAFPNTLSKACGKARQKHLLGLERTAACIESASQLASSSSSEPSSSSLLQQIEDLQQQVRELQKKSEQVVLCSQTDSILQHKSALTQGPITLDSFQQLDFDDIVNELQVQAPALYSMFMSLGNTKRNAKEDEVTTEQTKAVSSLCSLLNARSARVKGLQLLMSMMLVARATSRQV